MTGVRGVIGGGGGTCRSREGWGGSPCRSKRKENSSLDVRKNSLRGRGWSAKKICEASQKIGKKGSESRY